MIESTPKAGKSDLAHGAAKALLASVPGAGAVLAEVFEIAVTPSLEKRRERWLNLLAHDLNRLSNAVDALAPERLAKDECFISAILQASNAAMRTHDQEKLAALKNAVINTALDPTRDETVSALFLGLVDQFTVAHLRLLAYLAAPTQWAAEVGRPLSATLTMGGREQDLVRALPEFGGADKLYLPLIQDLHLRGLTTVGAAMMSTMMSASAMREPATTELGTRFLKFIAAPS